MTTLTIGKVAKRSNVGIETIRFYERNGLIPEPPRRPSGYREYPESVVDQIKFIRRAKELGFTLKEIKELMTIKVECHSTPEDIRKKTRGKIKDIEDKIQTLTQMKKILMKLTKSCENKNPDSLSECPILDALEH